VHMWHNSLPLDVQIQLCLNLQMRRALSVVKLRHVQVTSIAKGTGHGIGSSRLHVVVQSCCHLGRHLAVELGREC